ncbi:hypothetical protein ME1_00816 [Bartonella vinsonii subsp. arupensis OK-94-513]|uniref:Uncharacterized protein n=1 Tax=Bartonella vinsonii subsp. arupensis OK-94-513 TaxID=1094562 RepID=J1JT42_BARVI|nr:hypothetical protein [Bartonella vinsonii]EJF88052.1 hypothetical protein ME1_00816 [Bartonella vinsonii subsp. arupensis OK-94-513]
MINNSDNILSRLINSMYAMSPYTSRIMQMHNQRMAQNNAQQQANMLPYLAPSVPVGTVGSQPYPLGLAKDMPPLPNVSSALKPQKIQPDAFSSSPSMPMTTVGSQPHPLGLAKDIEPLPNALSDLTSLQPQQNPLAESPIPIAQSEPTQSVPQVQPRQDTTSSKSFWDQLRSPELLERLSDYALGYAMSDGTMAQDLANAAMNLRRGDMAREQRNQVNQTVEYLKSKGYSDEEATIMARNPQMLSAMLTGGDAPKLLAGHEWYTDPETGKRGQRPMTGTLQELEYNQKLQAQQEWEHKKKRNAFLNKQQLRAGLSDIADAIKLIKDGYATGFTGWGSRGIGGTPAYELDRLLDGIRGGVLKTVFENLKSMSATGNMGVGPISDFESKAMSSMFGSLDVGRDPKGLEKTLRLLETTLGFLSKFDDNKLYNAFTGQHLDTPKETSDQYSVDLSMPQENYAKAPIVKSEKDVESLPKGTVFLVRLANGNLVPVEK